VINFANLLVKDSDQILHICVFVRTGSSYGTPKRVGSQGASQATPKSQKTSQNPAATQDSAHDEMDDDFDITEAEMSMTS